MADDMAIINDDAEVGSRGPYTFEKVLGAAFLGALAGVLVYYVYNHLGDDTKEAVKEAVVSNIKAQVVQFAQAPADKR